MITRNVFFIVIFSILANLQAATLNLKIDKVQVECNIVESCKSFSDKFQNLIQHYSSAAEIKLAISPYLNDNSIKALSFKVLTEENQQHLKFQLELRKKIQELKIITNKDVDMEPLTKTLPHVEKEFYDEEKDFQAYKMIDQYLLDRGYGNNEIVMKIVDLPGGEISILYDVKVQRVVTLNDIFIASDQDEQMKGLLSRIMRFRGRVWQKLRFTLMLTEISRELFDQGYFNSKVEIIETVENKALDQVVIKLKLFYGDKTHFYFNGLKRFTHQEVLNSVRGGLKGKFQDIKQDKIIKIIQELYQSNGIYGTKITLRTAKGANARAQPSTSYYLDIKEGNKVKIESISFYGLDPKYEEELIKMFYEEASDLVSSGYYDQKYVEEFLNRVRLFYLERGHLFVKTNKAQAKFDEDYKTVQISFNIDERQQVFVEDISFSGIDQGMTLLFKDKLKLKKDEPINPVLLDKDIESIVKSLNAEGYYFARVVNSGSESILEFNQNYSRAKVNYYIDIGKESYLNEVIVSGNLRTKREVILRELLIRKNEIIKPEDVKYFQRKLSALGIFSFIKVSALVVNQDAKDKFYFVNLLVQVKEKDHYIFEVAPGYRTDLGAKLSSSLTILNLEGKDRTLNTKGQLNRRLTLDELDSRRRGLEHINEYSVDVNYIEPYFLPKIFDREFAMALSTQVNRKRFYGFDADIYKFSSTFSKDFTNWLGASVKYQFENIHQFEATESQDSGQFRIGGITPAVQFDFRDDRINPREGAFFGLSCEFANDWFGSMKNEKLEINFYKLVSRNKIYYPISKKIVLAFSASTGMQKNLAREDKGIRADGSPNFNGFIPSIKVFRLDGVDVVRGFSDDEINRLEDGTDISANIVDNKAFFTNFKLEPRYFLDDNLAVGLFFDAGRVSVNTFKPLELKTATGMSLKFVTPVGALNFDYGIKLKRESYQGSREGFGHFHLSIGYF